MVYAHIGDLKPAYPVFPSGQEIARYLLNGTNKYQGAVLSLDTCTALYELAITKERIPFVLSCKVANFFGNGPYLEVTLHAAALALLDSGTLLPYSQEERLEPNDPRYQQHYCFCYDDGRADAEQLLWVPEFVPLEADQDNWLSWRRNISKHFRVVRINDVAPPEPLIYLENAFFFDLVRQRENPSYSALEIGECINLQTPPLHGETADRHYVIQRVG